MFSCSPEFGVDLQSLGQHLGPHVSHGIPTDVQFGQRGVAAQSVEDDGEVGLQLGVSQGQRGQRLQGERFNKESNECFSVKYNNDVSEVTEE